MRQFLERSTCLKGADMLRKSLWGDRTNFLGTRMRFVWRCEGPHCFVQKATTALRSALQRVAAVEAPKNKLCEIFGIVRIMDFCKKYLPKADSLSQTSRSGAAIRSASISTDA